MTGGTGPDCVLQALGPVLSSMKRRNGLIVFRMRLSVLVPALAVATPLLAATPAAKPGSGNVTRAQMVAQSKAIFARADTNHDG
jgi:hypothetical protein